MSLVLRDAIARGASELDVASSEEQNSLLAELLQAVLKANERINIIGPCTVEEAVERHILDSLALMRLIQHVPRIRSWIEWTARASWRSSLSTCLVWLVTSTRAS